MKPKPQEEKKVSRARHAKFCGVCKHPQCKEIEAAFVGWRSPSAIAREFHLPSGRMTVYRHAWALGLMEKRRRNVRVALERIIERADSVKVSANAVVAAVQAYAKINSGGQWIERREHLDLNALFERMSQAELEAYAREGQLPDWFTQVVPVTRNDDSKEPERE